MKPFIPLTDTELEKLLTSLPHFERDPGRDDAFMQKLNDLQQAKNLRQEMRDNEDLTAGRFAFSWLKFAFAPALGVILLIGGGTIFAYQPSVTRTSFMYGWKQVAEKVELAITTSPASQANTHLTFSDRRLEEAQNIVEQNPSLAAFIQKADASDGENEAGLESKEEIALSATLNDMRSEVSAATDILQNKITEQDDITSVTEKVESALDRHVEKLTQLKQKHPKKAAVIVERFIYEEDDHLARVIEAHENFKAEILLGLAVSGNYIKAERPKIILRNMRREEKPVKHEQEAMYAIQKTLKQFESLSETERAPFKSKVEFAQKAFAEGKIGRAQGISWSLQNQMMHSKKPTGDVSDESEKQPKETVRELRQELKQEIKNEFHGDKNKPEPLPSRLKPGVPEKKPEDLPGTRRPMLDLDRDERIPQPR